MRLWASRGWAPLRHVPGSSRQSYPSSPGKADCLRSLSLLLAFPTSRAATEFCVLEAKACLGPRNTQGKFWSMDMGTQPPQSPRRGPV